MDKAKMKAVAQKMNKLGEGIESRAAELAELVREGLLTAEEAAASLAGYALKLREELDAPKIGPGLGYYRMHIDQQLGDYNISVKRHLS